jgi:hypothetical protein
MNGTSVSSTASVGDISTNWAVVGVADFNGDGLATCCGATAAVISRYG